MRRAGSWTRTALCMAVLSSAAGCAPRSIPLVNLTEEGRNSLWVWPHFLEGKPTVIVFWNSGVMQCIDEIPALKTLDAREGSVQLVTVVTGKDRPHIEKWVKRERIRYPVLLDLEENLAGHLGVDTYPTYLYLDVEGREVDRSLEVKTVNNWFDRPRWLERSGAIEPVTRGTID